MRCRATPHSRHHTTAQQARHHSILQVPVPSAYLGSRYLAILYNSDSTQPATEQCSGLIQDTVVLKTIKQGFIMQPKPLALPGSLLVASSTVHLLRLPMQVHRACGAEGQCLESCSCLDSASWKPVPASALNGMCTESSAVALVDSGATHRFVSAELVSRFSFSVKPEGDMEVTLADGSQVEASQTCCVPLVVCSGDY